MNSKMDTASNNPKFNSDSADLVGEWKACRVHVQRSIEGEERRNAMLLGRRERKKNILHMGHD